MLKKLPFLLILAIVLSILLNPIIPLPIKQLIYACSLTIKSIVLFLLPFIVFGLLFKTFVKLSDNALTVIVLIFGCVCASNFFNTSLTQILGIFLYHFDFNMGDKISVTSQLTPYFSVTLPNVIKNEWALFGGIVGGLGTAFWDRKLANNLSRKADIIVKKMFSIISVLIPLFIIGFVIKCASENILVHLIKSYSLIFAIYVCYAACYCFVFYLLVNKGILRKTIDCLKNMLPAAITALSTMSSAITMPVTILCTEKNVKHKDLASSVISTTTNIHLLGDCLAIPMLAYALLKYYSIPEPTCVEYLVFTIFFVIAKFSVAAVPAGGIIIMTPILEKYLHFTPEMSSLIIAIYMIFDPIVTSFNVLGNGALAKLIDQLYDKFVYRKKSSTS